MQVFREILTVTGQTGWVQVSEILLEQGSSMVAGIIKLSGFVDGAHCAVRLADYACGYYSAGCWMQESRSAEANIWLQAGSD